MHATLHAECVPRVIVDFDPALPDAPGFKSETSDLVFFLSWAFSARYGASHELALASLVLKTEFHVDLGPLLSFADRHTADEDDEKLLDEAWQDAAPLAACCSEVVRALDSDVRRLTEVRAEYPDLRRNIDELRQIAAWAAERSCRVRLTYELEELV
jgi:hypothetical protein